jgi:hypothetical protein
MMKKNLSVLLLSFFICQALFSQTEEDFEIKEKPIAEIYTDFHFNLDDTAKTTGFGLNKAYFGYNFLTDGDFSALIILNIGSPDELLLGSKPRRYAYFREAAISWTKDKLKLTFGITGTGLWDYQQKFWGKRYVANTFQSQNGYGFIADLGLAIKYKFNDIIGADFTIMNGEGYSDLQLDNSVKSSAGLSITPVKPLAIRLYGDLTKLNDVWQSTLIGFAGYKNELITIGIEANYKSSLDSLKGHNAWGISGTGAVSVTKKAEIFVRYDYSTSVTLPGENIQWNYQNDKCFAIAGIQYTFNQYAKIALNYQGTHPFDSGSHNSDAIYLNALFKF